MVKNIIIALLDQSKGPFSSTFCVHSGQPHSDSQQLVFQSHIAVQGEHVVENMAALAMRTLALTWLFDRPQLYGLSAGPGIQIRYQSKLGTIQSVPSACLLPLLWTPVLMLLSQSAVLSACIHLPAKLYALWQSCNFKDALEDSLFFPKNKKVVIRESGIAI